MLNTFDNKERQLRISRIKRQMAVLRLELDSIQRTTSRGSMFVERVPGQLSADEQLDLYNTRMAALRNELNTIQSQGLEEVSLSSPPPTQPPEGAGTGFMDNFKSMTGRRSSREDGSVGPSSESASSRKVQQMEMALAFLMDDAEPNFEDEAHMDVKETSKWRQAARTRWETFTAFSRRLCAQICLVWGSFYGNLVGQGKRTRAVRAVVLLSIILATLLILNRCHVLVVRRARHSAILAQVVASEISTQQDLNNPNTPQYKALNWISTQDTVNTDHEYLLQRYTLAVFWFSTQQISANSVMDGTQSSGSASQVGQIEGTWKHFDNWMSQQGICVWYGIKCHHRVGTGNYSNQFDENAGVIMVNMTSNGMFGDLPRELFLGLPDLRWLSVSGNSLQGTVPTEIGTSTKLRKCFLSSSHYLKFRFLLTFFSGFIEYLSLSNNKFSGRLMDLRLGQLTGLQRLEVQENEFQGSIPFDLGSLSHLISLSLYSNKLTGPIPDQLGNLIGLRALYLDDNSLTGSLPEELFNLHDLTDLRLSHNLLMGTLSPDIGALTSLQILQLDQNNFKGPIPTSFGMLNQLRDLRMYMNKLSGTIPTEVGNFHYLSKETM